MSTDKPFLKAFGVAAVAAFALTVLQTPLGFSFDRVQEPFIIAGCFLAGLITGVRAYFDHDSWSLRRISITCFTTILWMAFVLMCVLLYQARR